MALWPKGIADPEISVRRYRCPECGNYTLHIKYESFGECENGCFITSSETIDQIIDEKDYNGKFTEEELAYNFI